MYGFAIPCVDENTENVRSFAEHLRGFNELIRYCDEPDIAVLMFETEQDCQSAFKSIDWEKIGRKE